MAKDEQILAELTVRAANLADRVERAGALVAAAMLRDVAGEVEELIIRTAAPIPDWMGRGRAGARRPGIVR